MTDPSPSEAQILREVWVEISKTESRLFRNNVGVAKFKDRRGRTHTVVYGLHKGSSDLIGWTPHKITARDVGRTMAIFTALEAKAPGGRPTPEQMNFIEQVRAAGGIAAVVRSVGDAIGTIGRWRKRYRSRGPRGEPIR